MHTENYSITTVEIHEQKYLGVSAEIGKPDHNCQIAGCSMRTILRVKNSRGTNHMGGEPHSSVSFISGALPSGALPGPKSKI